ncbi:uncharacterized protein LOC128386379 isoform X1 [Panonychus citri]|uniref:uncharacterized protein LOC128386379 isoform X1 n=1 Tax=Panonychus citri TaxID=50023 RepID=UPI0023074A79|nr:uncharacterized protein LOC128386379 isoform X1 [Panonychus citri]
MLLNDLPDDCLWLIFDCFFDLEELIKLSQVCSKWSNLISIRFKRVKYLITKKPEDNIDYSKIWMTDPVNTLKHHNLRELLPNLRIVTVVDFLHRYQLKPRHFKKVITDNPKIKGLIGLRNECAVDLKNIEMISMNHMDDYRKVFQPDQLKQIYFGLLHVNKLPEYVEYFPNLKRLHTCLYGDERYNGPNLSKLKILEAVLSGWDGNEDNFDLLDFCPSLESALICCAPDDQHIDLLIKNYNLKDLVIEIPLVDYMNWSSIRKLLTKFPNLLHLAIRGSQDVADCHVEELVQLLLQIKLLDFRESNGITVKSADFLSKFCLKSNRSIKIYYDCENEPEDWPKYDTPQESIVYGFNFMKHCFYKSFSQLPFLIDDQINLLE